MKVIIAGSRSYRGGALGIEQAVKMSGFDVKSVVSGRARGADIAGEWWADANNIHTDAFPANWKQYGSKAGAIRNSQMANVADALIAIWDGKSPGTRDMISKMSGKPVFVYWDSKWPSLLTDR